MPYQPYDFLKNAQHRRRPCATDVLGQGAAIIMGKKGGYVRPDRRGGVEGGTFWTLARLIGMTRLAGLLLTSAIVLASAPAGAQAGATPPTAAPKPADQSAAHEPTSQDICRAVEQYAAENALPVEFFARVIWQESRFNAQAVSSKGAEGIAQFMPQTADWRGLVDPFDPIEALHNSASYLRDRFGNLGLAAAGYNVGPGRVSEWLTGKRSAATFVRPVPLQTLHRSLLPRSRTWPVP